VSETNVIIYLLHTELSQTERCLGVQLATSGPVRQTPRVIVVDFVIFATVYVSVNHYTVSQKTTLVSHTVTSTHFD